jgi:hypothetical protein
VGSTNQTRGTLRAVTSRVSHLRRAGALAAAAVLTAATVACGGGGDDLPPPASPEAPETRPTASDPLHQEILDVYYASVGAMVAAQQAGNPDDPALTRYFLETAQAHLNVQSTIQRNQGRGMYYTGTIGIVSAEVAGMDPDATPPIATIESCLDYSDYLLVHREDDSPVPDAETTGRVSVTAEAVNGTDDRWYIATSTAHWDEPC